MYSKFVTLEKLLPEGSKILASKNEEKGVCFALHGYGDNASNFSELAHEIGNKNTTWICVNGISPAPFPMGRQWFTLQSDYLSDLQKSVLLIESLVQTMSEIYSESNVTTKPNISLLGFSQGAALSLACGLQSAKPIKNVFALSGFLPFRHRLNIQHKSLAQTQFYISHGTQDAVVFPTNHFETVDYLKLKEAALLEASVFPIAHSIHPQQLQRISVLLGERLPGGGFI